MAQHEREVISKRTKEGLAEAKRNGKQLGTPENLTEEARKKAHKTISKKARTDKAVQVSRIWKRLKDSEANR